MFDKSKLRSIAIMLFIAGFFSAVSGSLDLAVMFLTIAGVAEVLHQAARPPLPAVVRGLFSGGNAVSELREHVEEDPALRNTLEYLYGLSPTDFMRVVRLATELRDEGSQRAMKEASDHFRKNRK